MAMIGFWAHFLEYCDVMTEYLINSFDSLDGFVIHLVTERRQ